MITHRIKPGDLGKFHAQLGARVQVASKRALQQTAKAAIPILQAETRKKKINAFGRLLRGWRAKVERWDSLLISNTQEYAVYVEAGRRRGATQPPSDALLPWVRKVLGVTGKAAQGVAFVVARAIKRRGIKARPVLTDPRVTRHIAQVANFSMIAALREEMARAAR